MCYCAGSRRTADGNEESRVIDTPDVTHAHHARKSDGSGRAGLVSRNRSLRRSQNDSISLRCSGPLWRYFSAWCSQRRTVERVGIIIPYRNTVWTTCVCVERSGIFTRRGV